MILSDDLTEIGSLFKPHGVKGELTVGFHLDLDPKDLKCLIVEIDGIFVPFFVESFRGSGKTLIKFEGIDNVEDAVELTNRPIYALKSDIALIDADDSDGIYLYDMVGWSVFDKKELIGKIEFFDDSTSNILMNILSSSGKIILVPFVEEWIESVDLETHELHINLPEGIINLNN